MPWPKLRQGLLQDLGFATPQDLANTIKYKDVAHLTDALAGKSPKDELMTALLRTFPAVPAMYFVESNHKVSAA